MNIRNAFKMFRGQATQHSTTVSHGSDEESVNSPAFLPRDELSNVVQLAPGSPIDAPAGLMNGAEPPLPPQRTQPSGLLDAPELTSFFSANYFGLGRHNGAQYKTQEALALGRQSLVSKFQNTLAQLVAQRQAKIDALSNMAVQTQGVCGTVTSQLHLASQRLERDMAALQSQVDLAAEGKGWILQVLNEYQQGFGKGLREAVDMDLLGY
jgi:hypothetical protein